MLGFLAANIAGRTLLGVGEAMLDRTPVVRSVYKSLKQIFETIFREGGTQFRKVGLVEYPAKGQWSIVFISSEPPLVIAEALGDEPMISVFLPCTPNPTTGFYFYVPVKDVVEVGDHAQRGGAARHVGRAHPADSRRRVEGAGRERRAAPTPVRVD